MRRDQKTLIVGSDGLDVAKKAVPVVEEALKQMLARPRVRPFVVLADVATEKFIQWCTSRDGALLFDVPALGIDAEPAPEVLPSAVRGLELLLQLCPSDTPFVQGLLLVEQDSHEEIVQFPVSFPGVLP